MYTRNHNGRKTLFSDPTMLKGWQGVFGTSDKRKVEEDLRRSQLDFAWQKRNGLSIVNKEAAVETHPETGDKVWFNHVQVKMVHSSKFKVHPHSIYGCMNSDLFNYLFKSFIIRTGGYVKFETGRNLLPVLKIVTCPAHAALT